MLDDHASESPDAPDDAAEGELLYVRPTSGPPNAKRTFGSLWRNVLGRTAAAQRSFFGADPVAQPAGAAQAAISDNSGGSAAPTTGLAAATYRQTIILPLQLADIAAGDFKIALPFDFTVISALFRTAKPASTASKLATLTASVNAVSVTGGVMALTTANQNTIGGTVAGTAITAGNQGSAGQTIGVTASAVTAFVEGSGWVEFTVLNRSQANAAATLAAQGNAIRAGLVSLGLLKGSA
ncbi:hypothetical protein [Bosea robiniae]|uniref:Head decoration protein n=1 Tax=Bosea robiniae TaxID=1036780 RepID=A0ABY0NEW9_9HYPH|nr:hypothetical protein [Bosea robiniae]SDF36789.1 hypothetical protein SAMN05421844_101444 [Bosea robiniae]